MISERFCWGLLIEAVILCPQPVIYAFLPYAFVIKPTANRGVKKEI